MNQQFKIACSVDNLQKIRSFVVNFLKSQNDVSEQELNLLVVAVDEICANLIIHSNNCNAERFIELSITSLVDGVLFEISDRGNAFDPSTYVEPSIHEVIQKKKKGGIGILLVNRIMDEVEYKQEKGYNICRMYKRISPVVN
jgi:serine/threonine-protein kinase RsbW